MRTEKEHDCASLATNPISGSVTSARQPDRSARSRNFCQAFGSTATFSKNQSLPVFQTFPSRQLYRQAVLPPQRFRGMQALVSTCSGAPATP